MSASHNIPVPSKRVRYRSRPLLAVDPLVELKTSIAVARVPYTHDLVPCFPRGPLRTSGI